MEMPGKSEDLPARNVQEPGLGGSAGFLQPGVWGRASFRKQDLSLMWGRDQDPGEPRRFLRPAERSFRGQEGHEGPARFETLVVGGLAAGVVGG